MNEKIENTEKPNDRITIKLHGEDYEVFMSAGLIRRIFPYYMSLTNFGEMFVDVDIQNDVLAEMIAERNKRGEPDMDTLEHRLNGISIEDSNELIKWSMKHAVYFFIENVTVMKNMVTEDSEMLKTIQGLMQSLSGSQNSQEMKQSVGGTI